jgi:surfactin synthase thioesterase subunit
MTTWTQNYHCASDAPVRLLCLPHAGGAADFYHPWSRVLHGRIQVLSVQYPGRRDRWREPVMDDVREVADAITAELLLDSDRRPVVLFGHSMGATVAFEVARRMEQAGSTPEVLVVSGRQPPTVPARTFFHRLDDNRLIAELDRLNDGDSGLSGFPELQQMVLPVVRSDLRMIETYQFVPGPELRSPIAAIIGSTDPLVTPEEMRGWAQMSTGGFAMSTLLGGHFYLSDGEGEVAARVLRLASSLSPRLRALPTGVR